MFFCLEDGTPLRPVSNSVPVNPATLENTLNLPGGEKTLALPTSDDRTLNITSDSPETIASPTVPAAVQSPAWQPQTPLTQQNLSVKTSENKGETYVPESLSQDYSGNNGKIVLGAVAGGLFLLVAAFGWWWYLQRSATDVAVVSNVNQNNLNQLQNNPDRLVLPNVNISGSANDGSNIAPGKNNSNFSQANQVNINQSSPKTTPTKEKTTVPGPESDQEIIEPKIPTPLPKSTPPPVPKTVSGGVLNGKAINLVKPPYPPAAKAVKASGAVSVQVMIDEEGNVISASAVSGHALLRAASEAAARASKFSPTILSGQKVKVTGVIVYNFIAQ